MAHGPRTEVEERQCYPRVEASDDQGNHFRAPGTTFSFMLSSGFAAFESNCFEKQAEQADVNWLNRAYEKHALTANEIAERKSTETRHIKPPPAKFTVALSLEEAESLRRALHLAQSKASQPLWMGSQLGLLTKDGLRLVASDDTSRQQQFQRLQEIKEQTAEKEPNSEDEDAQDAEDERLAMELSTRQAAADRKRQRDDEHLATVNRLAADFKRLGHNEKAVAYAEALAGQMMTIRALKECIEDDWAIGRQLLRFFDNVLWITQSDAVLILRALASIPESHRRLFFEQVMGCRRRDRVSWKDTGVEKIFAHSDDAALLKLSDWALRVSVGIATKYESMREAFKKFDSDNDNWLSLADLSAEISRMNLGLAAAEIQQLVEHVDMDKDGFLDFRSFAQAFAPKHNDFDSLLDGRKSSAKVTGIALCTLFMCFTREILRVHKSAVIFLGTKQTTSSLAFLKETGLSSSKGARSAQPEHVDNTSKMSISQLQTLGSLFLLGGGGANFQADNTVSTAAGQYPTICPRGVQFKGRKGEEKYFYEVTVLQRGRAVVGWGAASFTPNAASSPPKGVGDCKYSWGLDGFNSMARHDAVNSPCHVSWNAGDVIGCCAEIKNSENGKEVNLTFAINGRIKIV